MCSPGRRPPGSRRAEADAALIIVISWSFASAATAAAREESIQVLMKATPIRDRALYDRMSVLGLGPDGTLRVASVRADQELFLQLGQQDRPIDLDAARQAATPQAAMATQAA